MSQIQSWFSKDLQMLKRAFPKERPPYVLYTFLYHSCSFFTFLFILSGSRCFRTLFVVAFVIAFVRLKTAVPLVNTELLTYECVAFVVASGVAFVGASFRNHFVPFQHKEKFPWEFETSNLFFRITYQPSNEGGKELVVNVVTYYSRLYILPLFLNISVQMRKFFLGAKVRETSPTL